MKLSFRNRCLNLETPVVMGVLNVTPDSFSDGGMYNSTDRALARIGEMIEEGATIIDIGGESTRPGSDPVPAQTEIERINPVIKQAVEKFPDVILSADTMKAETAVAALEAGAHIINDVSGLQVDPHKAELCAHYGAGLVIMHAQGSPKIMQQNPVYQDVTGEVADFLSKQAAFAKKEGCKTIILDPGIGFGKTLEHNLTLLSELDKIVSLGFPVLVGASRKSMIGAILNGRDVDGRLAGTIAVHVHALLSGASIIRVHDVREAADSIRILEAIKTKSITKPEAV